MKFYILFMESLRCIMCVKYILGHLHLPYISVIIGEVFLLDKLNKLQINELRNMLLSVGYEMELKKPNTRLIELRKALHHWVDCPEGSILFTRSAYIADKFHCDYDDLAAWFKQLMHITIEKYCIRYRLSRVAERLKYGKHSVIEIAHLQKYKNVNMLYKEFKQHYNMTPIQYRNLDGNKDEVSEQVI